MYAATSSSPISGLVIFAVWLSVTFCGYNIGRKKGLAVLGTALGALLGLIGLFIISRASRSKTQPQMASVRSAQPSLVMPPQPLARQRNDGWWPDPLGRHEHRYHDGSRWTDHVSDDGVTSVSPLTPIRTPHQ